MRASVVSRALAAVSREEGVRSALMDRLKPSSLVVQDDSNGCEGGTLRVTITSEAFRGKTIVAQVSDGQEVEHLYV
jgi:stress-induced morphogen